jgi:cobyrinic acid a,c-diamide synthase
MKFHRPRIIIAGTSGDSGKTLVAVGLASALKKRGFTIFPFKKGPDYIDPMWLSKAGMAVARNLDTFIMGKRAILDSFLLNTHDNGIAIVEGNRGLYDGFDENGTHSTAELAKILDCPVILVVNVPKMTRTAGAIVWGLKYFDIGLNIAGVVINNFSGNRHKEIISRSISEMAGVEVIGAIPRLPEATLFPSRHLGLTTPFEFAEAEMAIANATEIVETYVDLDKVTNIATSARDIFVSELPTAPSSSYKGVKIGYLYDKAFSFYYKENLEALEREGAEVIPISSIESTELPDVDGLYIGGGFPETNALELSENKSFIEDLRNKAENGLPIFAECGGMMYLAEELNYNGSYRMVGVLPVKISMSKRPIGHGYFEGIVDRPNPFFSVGSLIRGHEFHYSFISETLGDLETCVKVNLGTGIGQNRDGIVKGNTFACYFHIHSIGNPDWARNFVEICLKNKNKVIHRNLNNIVK